MTVCVDARMINNSGIGVYIVNYVKYLLNIDTLNLILLGDKDELSQNFNGYGTFEIIQFKSPIYSIKEQFYYPFKIPNCDVFWSPHYNVPLFPIRAKRRVVTIPDAAHLALAKTFEFSLIKKIYSLIVFRAATYISDKIITISDFSKKEIIKYTGITPLKVITVHLGIDKSLFKLLHKSSLIGINEKYNLPEKFILFVGNVKPHKNLIKLLESFLLASKDINNIGLVILGKKEGFITGDNKVFAEINSNAYLTQNVHFTGYVQEADLPKIYNLASLFVFPSLYEGFGFPPIEAMSCGCPVICSNAASLPEICGDAVEYFNPNDSKDLALKIKNVITNEKLKKELIIKGFLTANKYTWEISSHQFLNNLL